LVTRIRQRLCVRGVHAFNCELPRLSAFVLTAVLDPCTRSRAFSRILSSSRTIVSAPFLLSRRSNSQLCRSVLHPNMYDHGKLRDGLRKWPTSDRSSGSDGYHRPPLSVFPFGCSMRSRLRT
jgi:hypothetical protein